MSIPGPGGAGGAPCMASAPIRRLRAPVESPVWGWLGGALGAAAGAALGGLLALPLLLAAALLLPCCLLARRLLLAAHLALHPHQRVLERVSGTEACWLGAAWGRSVLHAVLVLEGGGGSGGGGCSEAMDVGRLQDLVVTRVLPLYPRLTARPRSMPLRAGGGMCWVPDADFAIGRHVFPADCGGDGLQVYVGQLLDEDLPPDRPPWQLRLLPACGAHRSEVVVVLRVHSALADGDALVRLLCHALADNPMTRPKQVRRCRRGLLRFGLALVRAAVVGPLSLLAWLTCRTKDDNLLLAGGGGGGGGDGGGASGQDAAGGSEPGPGPGRGRGAPGDGGGKRDGVSVAWSAGIALSKVRRIQQVSRCSLNCVLLAAVGGAVRVLLQGCGVRQPPDLQVALPISMHRYKSRTGGNGGGDGNQQQPHGHHLHHQLHAAAAGDAFGDHVGNSYKTRTNSFNSDNNNSQCSGGALCNKTTPVLVGLPVSVEGAVPRLWATRRCLQYLRAAADPEVLYVASLAGSWASRLLTALTNRASIQFATLAGPSSTVLAGGAFLKAVYPLQPAPGRLGIAVSVLTYADQVFVTVASDAALGPAGTLLLQHFNVQIEMLWRLLRHRRAPGEARPPPALRRADVQGSPVGELTTRLSYVQGELERLASEDGGDCDGEEDALRLSSLKAEFTSLLHEVRKRQARARRMQDKRTRPGRRGDESGGRAAPGSGRRRKRAVSFSLPQRSSLSFGALLSGGRGEGGGDGSDAMLDDGTPTSSPSHLPTPSLHARPSVTISIPGEDDDEQEHQQQEAGGRQWVRASFERAARRSHANLDPQLAEYFRSVQLDAPGGSYPCRCNSSESSPSPSAAGYASCDNTSQEEDAVEGLAPPRGRGRYGAGRIPGASPEQEYEAIADAYYPAQLKNRGKFFTFLEDSPTEQDDPQPPVSAEARRPSCLKKVPRRDSTPSDQSSPSLSTSVLHQLRSYYDESYMVYPDPGDGDGDGDGDLTSPDELGDELPPPRERTAAFSCRQARTPPQPQQPGFLALPPASARASVSALGTSFTCRDADQMQYADDSDTTTPSAAASAHDVVALAMVHSPPPSPPTLSVKSSTPCLLSPTDAANPSVTAASTASTSPRPKFLTQSSSSSAHSHSASSRTGKHRQFSADNGYFEESVTSLAPASLSVSGQSVCLSLSSEHEAMSAVSADSVINLTSPSVSASPSPKDLGSLGARGGAAHGHGHRAFRSLSEEASPASLSPRALQSLGPRHPHASSEHVALLMDPDGDGDGAMALTRPTSLVIKKTYRN